eukprot:jgi/Tetstr1/459928/TSEL_005268.t1
MPWALPTASRPRQPPPGAGPHLAAERAAFSGLLLALLRPDRPLAAGVAWLRDWRPPPPRVALFEVLLQREVPALAGVRGVGSADESDDGRAPHGAPIYLATLPFRLQVNLLLLLLEQARYFPRSALVGFARNALAAVLPSSWTAALLADLLRELGEAVPPAQQSGGSTQPTEAPSPALSLRQEHDNLSQPHPPAEAPAAGGEGQLAGAGAVPAAKRQRSAGGEERGGMGPHAELLASVHRGLRQLEQRDGGAEGVALPSDLREQLDGVMAAVAAGEPGLVARLGAAEASDDVFYQLCQHVLRRDGSTIGAAAWVAGAIAPRLQALQAAASAPLLDALLDAGRNHPQPLVQEGLVGVAACPSLNAPQCEALLRVARGALPPAHRGALLAGALLAMETWAEPRAGEHSVVLLQGLLGDKPPPVLGEEGAAALAHFFLREAAGGLGRSPKFVKCLSTAVVALGGALRPHKAALRRAAEATATFLTKGALQKIDKL